MGAKVGFAQFGPVFGDWDANADAMRRLTAQAADADLLVFPELALTGYEFKDRTEAESLAEPLDGRTGELAGELAREHNVTLVVGYAEAGQRGPYNAALIALPNGDCFNYRKIHLFSRETFLFEPGDAEPPVIDTPIGRVGIMICFDWIFPETARILALGGAQIIAHPSDLVLNYCQRAMYCRSVENGIFTITANRVGTEERAGRRLTFTGASQILDPEGNTLAQAPAEGEAVSVIEIEPALADNKQITEHNHRFESRRVELYDRLLQPWTDEPH